MMDRIGARAGLALAVAAWSLAAMAAVASSGPWSTSACRGSRRALAGSLTGAVTPAMLSVAGFSVARFALGLAEGAISPPPSRLSASGIPRAGAGGFDGYLQ